MRSSLPGSPNASARGYGECCDTADRDQQRVVGECRVVLELDLSRVGVDGDDTTATHPRTLRSKARTSPHGYREWREHGRREMDESLFGRDDRRVESIPADALKGERGLHSGRPGARDEHPHFHHRLVAAVSPRRPLCGPPLTTEPSTSSGMGSNTVDPSPLPTSASVWR